MLAWISVGLGLLLIGLGIRDMFLTVLTSTGRGSISGWVMAASWTLLRPLVHRWTRYREVIGPVIFLGIICAWAALMIVGWALIYWPFLPGGFLIDFGLDSDRGGSGNFLTALYLSMVILATLGFGDIVPTEEWLRLLAPLESLIGFGLITASISWFLSIDPALSRRRRLTHQIALVQEAEDALGEQWDLETASRLLGSFATQIIELRSDQLQFPIMYYFRDADPRAELIPSLKYLRDIAGWAEDEFGTENHAIHLNQHMLQRAIDGYVLTITGQFLSDTEEDPEAAFETLMRVYLKP